MSQQRTGSSDGESSQVIDFSKAREQKLDEKRRKTERIFFRQILGIYTVSGDDRLREIEIVDVSEEGCSFQVPFKQEEPWPGDLEELTLRFYVTQDTYLPVLVKIQNSRPSIVDGIRYVRYGCAVDQTASSYPAYQQFVRFLKTYAVHAHKDDGNITFFYL